VTGCDFSFSALCVARRKIAEASSDSPVALVHGDVQRLPFADDSFDVIVSCETIEHVPDVRMAILEMHRVTRPGGKLFLTTPNYLNLAGLYELYARARRRKRNDDQPFDRRQCFPQIRRWIRGAGWKILGTDGTVHQFLLPGRSPVRLEGVESNRTVRRLLSPFALHYFVVAQKRALE
jgi:ubiquinone/menaquinone biosynthesis C-methylase UbiE